MIIIYIYIYEYGRKYVHIVNGQRTNHTTNQEKNETKMEVSIARISIHNDASRHNFDYRIANSLGKIAGGGGGGRQVETRRNMSSIVRTRT